MILALSCIPLALLVIYAVKIPVAIAMHRLGGYDNRHPREQQAQLVGWGKRALAAHQNGFETFPAFAVAVLLAHVQHGDAFWSAVFAVTFVVSRVCYSWFYMANWSTPRTLVWGIGFGCIFGLFIIALL